MDITKYIVYSSICAENEIKEQKGQSLGEILDGEVRTTWTVQATEGAGLYVFDLKLWRFLFILLPQFNRFVPHFTCPVLFNTTVLLLTVLECLFAVHLLHHVINMDLKI